MFEGKSVVFSIFSYLWLQYGGVETVKKNNLKDSGGTIVPPLSLRLFNLHQIEDTDVQMIK